MSFVICNIRISFVIHVHAYIWSACARNLCKAVFWRDHWTHFQKPLPQGLPGWWIPTTSPIGRAHPRNPHPFIHVVYIYIQGHAYEDILPDGLNWLQSCLNWYIYIYIHMYHVSIYLCIYVPMYIICIIMYIRIIVYMSICKDVYMYIYIYIYTSMYKCMQA